MAHGTAQQGSALGVVALRAVRPAAAAGQEEEAKEKEKEKEEEKEEEEEEKLSQLVYNLAFKKG